MINIDVNKEITLKSIEQKNAEVIFKRINKDRYYLSEWLSWVGSTEGVIDTLKYISMVKDKNMYNGRLVLEIWYKNEFAGLIDLHNGDRENKKAEIGYWLGKDFQGKGIMTKSCASCLTLAFNKFDLNRIVIKCAKGNKKSQSIPKRLNFKFEGIEREGQLLYDEFVDLYNYSILKSEWENK